MLEGIKICPNCDEIVDNSEKVCPNCDSFFLRKKCPKCGEIMKDDVKKGWNCGWTFSNKKKKKKNELKIDYYTSYIDEIKNIKFKENIEFNEKKERYIKLTEEQIDIIKKAKNNNLIINAFAGTGKSTTLLSIAYALKKNSFLFLAFNKSVKLEIEEKIKKAKLNNIKVLTTHGLAYKFVKNDLNIVKLGKELNTSEISKLINIDIYIADYIRTAFNDFCNGYYNNISNETVEKILNSNSKLRFIQDQKEYVKNKLLKLWELFLNGKIPITHSVYLKYFQINIEKYSKYINFDYVLLDEAQDTNEVVLDIFKKLKGKKIIVGDPHQQIYSFRGSVNAMYKIKSEIKADVAYLTKSFRFSKNIAEKANNILNKFKCEDKEITPFKNFNKKEIRDICFITRTNATLIKLMENLNTFDIQLIRSPKEIFNLPINIYYFMQYLKNEKYKKYINEKWLLNFNSLESLRDYAEDFEDFELISAINIAEEYKERLFDLLKKIEEKYSKKSKSNIYLTTAHTSKGLEWDKVVICHDFQNILDLLKKEKYKRIKEFNDDYKKYIEGLMNGENLHFKHQYIIDEINLLYVAITRAKKELKIYSNKEIFNVDINKRLEV